MTDPPLLLVLQQIIILIYHLWILLGVSSLFWWWICFYLFLFYSFIYCLKDVDLKFSSSDVFLNNFYCLNLLSFPYQLGQNSSSSHLSNFQYFQEHSSRCTSYHLLNKNDPLSSALSKNTFHGFSCFLIRVILALGQHIRVWRKLSPVWRKLSPTYCYDI